MTTNTKPASRPTSCIDCNTKLTKSNRASSHGMGADLDGLCVRCYDYAGWENTHSDDNHDAEGSLPDPDCMVCQARKPAELPVREGKGPKGTHINHAACYAADVHTKDREGRERCRDAELWKKLP